MSTRHNFIIAIDGFSSCGKSTLAKALAKKLKFAFIDSGAMYRAVTLYFIRHNIALDDQEAIDQALNEIHIDFIPNAVKTEIHLNDEDISEEIRQMFAHVIAHAAGADHGRHQARIRTNAQALAVTGLAAGQRQGFLVGQDAAIFRVDQNQIAKPHIFDCSCGGTHIARVGGRHHDKADPGM